eukprot:scaffold2623_cov78-Phaeocystis_antarctica.AAC.1
MTELLEHAWVKEAAAKCRARMEEKAKAPKEATAAANATPQPAASERSERSGVPTCSGCALL